MRIISLRPKDHYVNIYIRNKFHRSVIPNVDDIVPLLSNYLATTTTAPAQRKARQESMQCLQVSKFFYPQCKGESGWLNGKEILNRIDFIGMGFVCPSRFHR